MGSGIKTTLVIDREIYRAAKRLAVDQESTVSSILNKGLLLYLADPESGEEMAEILTDRKAVTALIEGREARAARRKGYYVEWTKLRGL